MLVLSARACVVSIAVFTLSAGWINSTTIALAIDECGAVLGPVVSCTVPDPGGFAGGITYSTSSGLTINIGPNIVVTRITAVIDEDAILLTGSGAGDLTVNLAAGSIVSTNFESSDPVAVHGSALTGNLYINAGGTVNVAGGGLGVGSAVGLYATIRDLGATGDIVIRNLATGVINVTGGGNRGIEGTQLADALGSVTIYNDGLINVDTPTVNSSAMVGWVTGAASSGDVALHLGSTGRISLTADLGSGMFVSQDGLGDGLAIIDGQIETFGLDNWAVVLGMNNPASSGTGTVLIGETATMSVNGDFSRAVSLILDGTTTSNVRHAGSISGSGTGVTGIYTGTTAGNTASHVVELVGTGSIQINGDDGDGALFDGGGASSVSYTLAGSSSISTTGARSDGIDADLGTGNITARLAAAAGITVTGAESVALKTRSPGVVDIAHAGTNRASGEYGVGILAESAAAAATVQIGAGGSVLGGWQADVASFGPTTAFPSAGVLIAGATATLQNAGSIGALSDRAVADTGLAPGNLALTNSGTVTGFVDLSAGGTNTWVNAAGGLFDVRHFADTNGDGTRDTKRVSVSNFGAPLTSSFDNQSGAAVRLGQVTGDTAIDAAGYYVPTTGVANNVLDATFYTLSRTGVVQGQFTNIGTFTNSGIIDLRGAQSGNTLVMTGNTIAGGAVSPAGGLFTSNGGQLLLNTIFNTGVPLGGQGNSFSDVLVVDRTSVASGPTGINILGRSGPGGETPGNGILLVEVRDTAASAPLAFALNGDYAEAGQQRVVGGAFAYALYQNGVGADIADGNWYLRNVGISPNSGIYEDTPNILFPLIEMPMLQERVGNRYWAGRDPGNAPAPQTVFCKDATRNFVCTLTEDQASYYLTEDNRVVDSEGYWAQVTGLYGRYTPKITTHANDHDLAYFGIQAGRDTALMETDTGVLVGGLSLRYGNVRGTSGTASLAAHGFGAGASLTYYDDSGLYFDGQAAATLFSREYSSSLMGRLAHDAMGLGYGFSLETGYRAAVSDKWALTPQVQLSYTNLAPSTFTDRLGAAVSIEDGHSLEGRLGLAAEYQDSWKEADGTTSRLKLNAGANLYNEFLPDSRVSLSGFVLDSRKPGQWVGVSAGGTYNWNNDMNSLYGEIAANTSIANFGQSHELKGNLGLRVKW